MSIHLTNWQGHNLIEAAKAAVEVSAKYGVPPLLIVAQWAQESGWGRYQPGCNCFGIKDYEGCHGTQTVATHEYIRGVSKAENQTFATFPDLAACFAYHSELISQKEPYQEAWRLYTENHDAEELLANIAPHYATDPKYATHVRFIMRDPAVIEAVASARKSAKLEQV